MKRRILLYFFFAALLPAFAEGANFVPKTLRISAPNVVRQASNGPLVIPFTLSGTGATITLAVYTKDKAAAIRGERNGYLGWHYVNKIDTCLYISPPSVYASAGSHSIIWDGRESGYEMTYYLWGYDHTSSPEAALLHAPMNRGLGTFVTHDTDGKPMANPEFFPTAGKTGTASEPTRILRHRWVLGYDPSDPYLVETTAYMGWNDTGVLALDSSNHGYFYTIMDHPDGRMILRKYRWVPQETAILDTSWGNNGEWSADAGTPPEWWRNPGVIASDNGDYLFVTGSAPGDSTRSELVWIDRSDGSVIMRQVLDMWHEQGNGGTRAGAYGPTCLTTARGTLAAGSHASCLHLLLNPYGSMEDSRDLVMYANGAGDDVGDKISGTCHDPDAAPRSWTAALDKNLFLVFPTEGLAGSSFGALAPDGTGVGYFPIGGGSGIPLRGAGIVHSGSAFDGLYLDCGPGEYNGLRFIAHDSFKGVIVGEGPASYPVHFIRPQSPRNLHRATVLVDLANPPAIPGETLTRRDEIGAFAPDGRCVGAIFWMGNSQQFGAGKMAMYILGDHPGTPAVDGLRGGESFTFRLFDFDTNSEYPATATFESGEAVFREGATYTISSLRADTIVRADSNTPPAFTLLPNNPNPFNPTTTITFTLPKAGQVNLIVHDATGRKVAALAHGVYPAGKHSVTWNATDYASGMYFCTLRAGKRVETRKMLLVR